MLMEEGDGRVEGSEGVSKEVEEGQEAKDMKGRK